MALLPLASFAVPWTSKDDLKHIQAPMHLVYRSEPQAPMHFVYLSDTQAPMHSVYLSESAT